MKSKKFSILRYAKFSKLHIALSLVLAIIIVASSLLIPFYFGKTIDFIVGKNNVNYGAIVKNIIYIASLIGINCISQTFLSNINSKITNKITKNLRDKAFLTISNSSIKYLDSNQRGQIISRVISDVTIFSDGLNLLLSQFFVGILTILGTLIVIVSINIYIALIVAILTPLSLFMARFITKKTKSMFTKRATFKAEQTALIDDMISGIKTVKSYNFEKNSIQQFDDINEKLDSSSEKATFFSSLTNPLTRGVNNIIYASVAIISAIFAVNGNTGITVGVIAMLLSYANSYTKPFNEISQVITELQAGLISAKRINELIENPHQDVDLDSELELTMHSSTIEFKDVCFSYDKDRKLIENFNLLVEPSKMIAIVGQTGSGKTTLINLLMRFYDPVSGGIYFDKTVSTSIKKSQVRQNFGMVLQDTFIKRGTVKENIDIANHGFSDKEIEAVCKECFAHGFIKNLEHGYDTLISEDNSLSVGQKQLLCIARVMLLKPKMLILDEATSSIDTRTESKISKAFDKLMQGKTTFIVAHRLSTITKADTILFLKDGNVVEKGSHNELIKLNGHYKKLFDSQFE